MEGGWCSRADPFVVSCGSVLVRAGKIILTRGYGLANIASSDPVTKDTVYPLASVTKLFTVLLLSDMVCRGEVSLDDPVADYLPSGAIPGPTT